MMDIKIDTWDLSKLGLILKGVDVDTHVKGGDIIKELATQTYRGIIFRVPKDKGKLKDSVRTKVIRTGKYSAVMAMNVYVGEGLDRPYATYQEYGFARHAVPADKYPEIRDWMRRHGKRGKYLIVQKPLSSGYFVQPTINEVFSEGNVAKVSNVHVSQIGRRKA
jgi:hypothetical protein